MTLRWVGQTFGENNNILLMKRISIFSLLLFGLILFVRQAHAQVFTGNLTLADQTAVDNFA